MVKLLLMYRNTQLSRFYLTRLCIFLNHRFYSPSKHVYIGPISAVCWNIAIGIPTSDRRRPNIDDDTDSGLDAEPIYDSSLVLFTAVFITRILHSDIVPIRIDNIRQFASPCSFTAMFIQLLVAPMLDAQHKMGRTRKIN